MDAVRENHCSGFSLIEIVMVVVILGVMSVVAMVKYQDSIKAAREQDAVAQLQAIHTANELYYSKSNPSEYLQGTYPLNDPGGDQSINDQFGLSIFANGLTYTYTSTSTTTYTATADEGNFTVRVNETVLGASNPCCSAGTCPTLPSC